MLYIDTILLFALIFILIWFRKSQREFHEKIDETSVTPSDYTLIVKNIPTGLDINYKETLKTLFENEEKHKGVLVKKILLVYDIKEVEEKELKIKEIIKEKKLIIQKNNYQYSGQHLHEIDKLIKENLEELEEIKKKIMKNEQKYFGGLAFISVNKDEQKRHIL